MKRSRLTGCLPVIFRSSLDNSGKHRMPAVQFQGVSRQFWKALLAPGLLPCSLDSPAPSTPLLALLPAPPAPLLALLPCSPAPLLPCSPARPAPPAPRSPCSPCSLLPLLPCSPARPLPAPLLPCSPLALHAVCRFSALQGPYKARQPSSRMSGRAGRRALPRAPQGPNSAMSQICNVWRLSGGRTKRALV